MSQQNVEFVRQALEAWNRGYLKWLLDRMTPEFEFRTARLFPDLEPAYRGPEAFTRFWNTFREAREYVFVEVERIEPIGDDRVLVLFRFHGRGRDGVDVRLPYAQIFTLEDRTLRVVVGFASWQEALEAAGLQE